MDCDAGRGDGSGTLALDGTADRPYRESDLDRL